MLSLISFLVRITRDLVVQSSFFPIVIKIAMLIDISIHLGILLIVRFY